MHTELLAVVDEVRRMLVSMVCFSRHASCMFGSALEKAWGEMWKFIPLKHSVTHHPYGRYPYTSLTQIYGDSSSGALDCSSAI